MSLVSLNNTNNWRVVLRDENRQALVLFDNSSKEMTLVNDPEVFSRFERRPSSSSNGGGGSYEFPRNMFCSNCGQFMSHGERMQRDSNYFRLLQQLQHPEMDESPSNAEPVYSSISQSSFSQGYFDRFFIRKRDLGRGSRGAVHLVEHVLDGVSLGLFALKKVPVGDDHVWLEKVLAEVHLLKLLTHPNLVSYNHVWLENSQLTKFGPEVPCAFILQEYCDSGTLEDYIRERQQQSVNVSKRERIRRRSQGSEHDITSLDQLLTIHEILAFFTDIVSGIKHLHQNQIIHRDIKPSNCLLSVSTNSTSPLPRVLVSDFGEGQMEGIKRSETGSTGTLEYCAPELITQIDGHLSQFSKKTDIFSLGMVLHYLCFSRLPYSANPWEERVDVEELKVEVENYNGFDMTNYTGFVRQDLPKEIYYLLSKMLSIVPEERPDCDEILFQLEQSSQRLAEPASAASLQLVRKTIEPQQQKLNQELHPVKRQPQKHVTFTTFAFIKSLLFIIKAVSYSRMDYNNHARDIIILLIGIEIPFLSLTGSIGMFLLHFLVLLVASLVNKWVV